MNNRQAKIAAEIIYGIIMAQASVPSEIEGVSYVDINKIIRKVNEIGYSMLTKHGITTANISSEEAVALAMSTQPKSKSK